MSLNQRSRCDLRSFAAKLIFSFFSLSLTACAVPNQAPQKTEVLSQAVSPQKQPKSFPASASKNLKRKIAIGRFTNETRYGRTFLRDGAADPLGKQASDMLASRLVDSGSFLVFERTDLDKLQLEQGITGQSNLIGVDTLILGSVTEFGRNTVGKSGFFSSTLRQVVHAKIEIRLADPKTGHVFFSAAGQGEATNEASDNFGFGSRADYDASLNDKAIGAAISDVMNSLVSKLDEKQWRTDILKIAGSQVYISGGERQGLKIGDKLVVMKEGEKVKSGQTGFVITLPSSQVATLEIVSVFGTNETDEGSVCRILSGTLPDDQQAFYVTELKD
ncbi:MAG: curli production assembly protein CsgG [Magnetovibrio sp.]|nr:curli production assembly protein CsgG [Magnetovibrio sp.]